MSNTPAPSGTAATDRGPLTEEELRLLNAFWRAANYLSVGQICLLDNPSLREPLQLEHVKPRLLGHWGTTPGLNLIYAYLNRVIVERGLDAMNVIGPGHGGPGLMANAYLEGTYSEGCPQIAGDSEGLRRLFRQFSFPGGIPSHVMLNERVRFHLVIDRAHGKDDPAISDWTWPYQGAISA